MELWSHYLKLRFISYEHDKPPVLPTVRIRIWQNCWVPDTNNLLLDSTSFRRHPERSESSIQQGCLPSSDPLAFPSIQAIHQMAVHRRNRASVHLTCETFPVLLRQRVLSLLYDQDRWKLVYVLRNVAKEVPWLQTWLRPFNQQCFRHHHRLGRIISSFQV